MVDPEKGKKQEEETRTQEQVVVEKDISARDQERMVGELSEAQQTSAVDDAKELAKAREELGLPPEKEKTAESLEIDFGAIRKMITDHIDEDTRVVDGIIKNTGMWIGATEDGEEIYTGAENSQEVLAEVDKIIQQATVEKWDQEKLMDQLFGIKVKMDVNSAQKAIGIENSLPDFVKPESKLGDFDWFG